MAVQLASYSNGANGYSIHRDCSKDESISGGRKLTCIVYLQDESYNPDIDGGQLWVKDTGEALGEKIRIRILARDVSLALKNYSDTSIINRLKTRVVHLQVDSDPAMVIVTLSCGGNKLISRISKRSADHLGINVGKEVWAQIKGVAILR